MSRLEDIRERLTQAGSGRFDWDLEDLAGHYADDVEILLNIAESALAYRAVAQIPDGVQAAEQVLFAALDELEQST